MRRLSCEVGFGIPGYLLDMVAEEAADHTATSTGAGNTLESEPQPLAS